MAVALHKVQQVPRLHRRRQEHEGSSEIAIEPHPRETHHSPDTVWEARVVHHIDWKRCDKGASLCGQLIKLSTGKEVLYLGGYTYYMYSTLKRTSATRWRCTRSATCSSTFVHLDAEMNVLPSSKLEHNHPPTQLWRMPDGTYVKMAT
ncbi:hypothetical protein ACJJTC_012603 [Scirpophaga incertulas]